MVQPNSSTCFLWLLLLGRFRLTSLSSCLSCWYSPGFHIFISLWKPPREKEFCPENSAYQAPENALPHLLTYDLKILGNCPPNAINSVVCPSANLRQKFGEVREPETFHQRKGKPFKFFLSDSMNAMDSFTRRYHFPLLLNILFLVSLWAPICSSRGSHKVAQCLLQFHMIFWTILQYKAI